MKPAIGGNLSDELASLLKLTEIQKLEGINLYIWPSNSIAIDDLEIYLGDNYREFKKALWSILENDYSNLPKYETLSNHHIRIYLINDGLVSIECKLILGEK